MAANEFDLTEKCMVTYAPPDRNLTDTMNSNLRGAFESKPVDLRAVFDSMKTIVYRFIDAEEAGRPLNPDDFVWNIYEQLGIPEYSYLTMARMPPRTIPFMFAFPHLFELFSKDVKFLSAFTSVTQGGYFKFRMVNESQIMWTTCVNKLNKSNHLNSYYADVFSDGTGSDLAYKIHFTPKHQYALYTMLRLWSIQKREKIFHNKYIDAKLVYNFRLTKPRDENTYVLHGAGGAMPTLVFYGDSNSDTMKTILEVFLREFGREAEHIGSMTPDYTYRILPFNIRLNSVLSYARGDRSSKLSNRDLFFTTKNFNYPEEKKYKMPTWVSRLMASCKPTNRVAGDLSMRLLGKNVCLPEVQTMLQDPDCMDDICWLSYTTEMIDPLTLDGLGVDVSRGTDPEADTTQNNLVVHTDTELAPGKKNAAGGMRKLKRTRRLSSKKQKKQTRKQSRRIRRRA